MLKATTTSHVGILESEEQGTRTDTQMLSDCKEGYKAMIFFMNADPRIYSKLWRRLSESVTLGINQYPRTVTAAFEILSKCKPEQIMRNQYQQSNNDNTNFVGATFTQTTDNPSNNGNTDPNNNNGTVFMQATPDTSQTANTSSPPSTTTNSVEHDTLQSVPMTSMAQVPNQSTTSSKQPKLPPVMGSNGILNPNVTCFKCKHPGHIAPFCPFATQQPMQNLQISCSLSQSNNIIPPSWVLLDTGSTISSIMNSSLVYDFHQSNRACRAFTNGGHIDYNIQCQFKIFPLHLFYNPDAIANILSFAEVASSYRVTMDTNTSPDILVHISPHMILHFRTLDTGLYFIDTDNIDHHIQQVPTSTQLLTTVEQNKNNFTRRQVQGADDARVLQERLGWPATSRFIHYINNGHILNCPITEDDVRRSELIYGPPIPILKGKTVRNRPSHIPPIKPIHLPNNIVQQHSQDELDMDHFWVNGTPFFHTKSHNLNFITTYKCDSTGKSESIRHIDKATQLYANRGFAIVAYHGDNAFECLRMHLGDANLHTVAKDEHVPGIERSIRTVKERCRSISAGLPYSIFPKVMTRAMVDLSTDLLNSFPNEQGISTTLSPNSIVKGKRKINYESLKTTFGSYAQVFVKTKNSNIPRTVGAIALMPSNEHGGYYFMSLVSGKKIHGMQWKNLPISQDAIDRVHTLAKNQKQPVMKDGPIFEWSPGIPIDDDDVPVQFPPSNTDINDHTHVPHDVDIDNNDIQPENEFEYENNEHQDDESHHSINDHVSLDDLPFHVQEDNENDDDQQSVDSYTTVDADVDTPPDGDQNAASPHHNYELRSDRQLDYSKHIGKINDGDDYIFTQTINTNEINLSSPHRLAAHVIFSQMVVQPNQPAFTPNKMLKGSPQMSARKGIKLFGERAVQAVMKEYKQLNMMNVFDRINSTSLSKEQKAKALRAITLIKEKKCGTMKGRTCADGRSQRRYIPKEETSSPTNSLETLIVTLIIDAYEQRQASVFDIPGAYLNAYLPDTRTVLIKFEQEFVDIMCTLRPELQQDVIIEGNKQVLYMRIVKALYGCVDSALLWYKKFSEKLIDMGFIINPYDACIANKSINGKQCTVAWYVDDVKISHSQQEVIDEIINELKKDFGDLKVTRGDEYTFLGMKIKMLKNKTVSVSTINYIHEVLDQFPQKFNSGATTPATTHIFEINETAEKLSDEKAEIFHSIVAKLLWIAKRGRPDIELPISFLCTRVQSPDVDDWSNLERVLKFLYATINDERIIGALDLSTLFTYIDTSYGVHPNLRSHTGGTLSMGIGTVHNKSSKQKLNVKSSTAAEIVGGSDYLPYSI